ncbi:hypothetical protein Vadar_005663 [Vaccinium darrowii]|uniref:Uncharacterized protein n=1 Tax=Vaccinium darrowii TaxID=229202 RepID=A0ACB7WYG6_9ERIC|nr:hypothetical protein Vadar_005663 [Vaccinium darrowii]
MILHEIAIYNNNNGVESYDQLFFTCPMAGTVWQEVLALNNVTRPSSCGVDASTLACVVKEEIRTRLGSLMMKSSEKAGRISVMVVCFSARKLRRAIVSKLQHAIATIRRTPKVVQHWEINAPTMESILQDLAKEKLVRFTAQQLCSFTTNYSTVLGSGGFGLVYKGQMPNGVKIAVKVLKRSLLDKRAAEQFMAEVSTIGRTYHINLVRLYGFSYDRLKSALVFEYMENGSLDKYLFSNDTQGTNWNKQLEIAIGTAKAIAYLHEGCQPRIIHYDIKPANVLLDVNFNPKVTDFGLPKLCNGDNTHDPPEGYKGTPGYSAPEFLLNNYPITQKCDVYSFSMLLFEIVGRRRNAKKVGSSDSLDWFPKNVWDKYEKGVGNNDDSIWNRREG